MNQAALHSHLARERQRAAAAFVLDEELGSHHGLSWDDFLLLDTVGAEPDGLPQARLAALLGTRRSKLLIRMRPLEKLGLLACKSDGDRQVVTLGKGGRRVLNEARETAAATCTALAARPG